MTFNKEARDRYLAFATGSESAWSANFRDLSASVTRMATLAPQCRINREVVDDEISRLKAFWRGSEDDDGRSLIIEALGEDAAASVDRFDAIQLAEVIRICRGQPSASAAGRALFAQSRLEKKSANDADRLVKYLGRFGLKFEDVRSPR